MLDLNFDSGGTRCSADLYRPTGPGPAPCVVMGHGFTGTKDQLAGYAERFAEAGLAVLAFDYRSFGVSDGEPRQVVDVKGQLQDWRAAIRLARTMDGIDGHRLALWGSSLSGGHVINLAVEDPTLAAVVAQVPAIDKSTRGMVHEARAKMQREGISLTSLIVASLGLVAAGVDDTVRGILGLAPHYIPVFGRPGEVAAFTDPSAYRHLGFFVASGPTWRNEFASRFLFRTPRYTKGTAERVAMPLLVCVAEQDCEANPELAVQIGRSAPRGEVKTYPVPHFDVYSGPTFDQMLTDQTEFLLRTLVHPGVSSATRSGGPTG